MLPVADECSSSTNTEQANLHDQTVPCLTETSGEAAPASNLEEPPRGARRSLATAAGLSRLEVQLLLQQILLLVARSCMPRVNSVRVSQV